MLHTNVKVKLFAFGLNSFLIALILTACNGLGYGAAPETGAVETENPSPTLWQHPTPTSLLSTTPAQTVCPPFSIDTALPVPDEPQNYIGLHFDTAPNGLESAAAFMLGGPDTDYLVSVMVGDGDKKMLWLERVICHDNGGHAYKEIRAVNILPALQEKEKVITGTCKISGEVTQDVAPEIVAIGWFEDVHQPPVTISYAWRANPKTEAFEVLSPESVTCSGLRGL